MQSTRIRRFLITVFFLYLSGSQAIAQVGIGTTTPDTSAILELKSSTKGFIAPRMNAMQMAAIASPATGLTIFNTDSNHYFVHAGTGWIKMLTAKDTVQVARSLSDADRDTKVETEQSADDDKIRFSLGGTEYFRMNKGALETYNTAQSVYIGESAGATHRYGFFAPCRNVGIGYRALQNTDNANDNVAIGANALAAAYCAQTVAIGSGAAMTNAYVAGSVFVGSSAGHDAKGGNNVMVGYSSGYHTVGSNNTFVGARSGNNNSGSGNVCLGNDVAADFSTDNQLFIDNSGTAAPLIFGDFSKDSLRFNGSVNINGQYNLPKTAGSNGYLMQTDGAGNASWVSPAALTLSAVATGRVIDADSDTRVETERTPDDDQIRFRLGGTDRWLMTGDRLENTTSNTLAIGRNAGLSETGLRYNLYYGINAGQDNVTGLYNTAIGNNALKNNTASQNVAIGQQAAGSNISGVSNTAVGTFSQYANTSGSNNVSIGKESLHDNLLGSGNIAIGSGAGYYETGSNKLYIDNSRTSTPLIYGDFAADSLRLNGRVNINGNYTLPAAAGTNGYVMQIDGAGTTSWVSPAAFAIAPQKLNDADANTSVDVERTSNDDKIRFKLAGTEEWVMTGNRLENASSASLIVGRDAGLNEIGLRYNVYYGESAGRENVTGLYNTALGSNALRNNTASENVAVGFQAAAANTTGGGNVAVGVLSIAANTQGNANVALGNEALRNNQTGSGNIAIGTAAGYNETGSDKLYIDNSSTTTPLIYGDFAADSLRINGTLNINGNYTFPTTAGTNGYALTTNGAGQTSWTNISLTETDPKVSSSTDNKVPKWNGTTLTDGLIYDSGTSVGIGTIPANTESTLVLGAMNSSNEGGQLQLRGASIYTDHFLDNNSGNLRFLRGSALSSVATLMTLTYDGNLGVGTAGTPAARVDVSGNINASDTVKTSKFKMTNGATTGYMLTSDAAGNAKWTAPVDAETDPQVSSSATNRYPYWNGTTLVDGNIYRNSSNGFTGIGVSNAAVPLETNGSVRFSSTTNADIQLNSGARPTIYPSGPNVPTNLEVQLRSAGSSTLFFNLDNTGNVSAVAGGGNMMVGAGAPAARLDVGGTFKLGTDGSVLTSVIKSNYGVSTASIGANTATTYTITVNGATTGASVSVSPNADMPNGVYIASARVSSSGTVTLKIYNATGNAVSLSSITNYYITVIN